MDSAVLATSTPINGMHIPTESPKCVRCRIHESRGERGLCRLCEHNYYNDKSLYVKGGGDPSCYSLEKFLERKPFKKFVHRQPRLSVPKLKVEKRSDLGDLLDSPETEFTSHQVKAFSPDCTEYTPGFVVASQSMRSIVHFIEKIARKKSTVLISGESGVGKEIIARAISDRSGRGGRYVVIDCTTIVPELADSELFGSEKGAFTGAVVGRVGLFEVADKGTIFIDEISELPLALQGKLLRVMETRQIRRVGRPGYVDLDIRIVVATNRDLRKMVREGTFRHDLYQRLNILKIDVPPLRERPEDTFSLIAHFMRQFDIETVSKKVLIQLVSYPWPGNIREMKHALESAVITSDIPKIDKVDLDPIVNDDESQKLKRPSNNLKQVVRDHILYVFRKNKGNVRKAAEELGIMRPTMYNKLKEYGIK